MAKITRFEALQSWQKARQLANTVHDLSEHAEFAGDFRLSGKIRDAAGSAMHNIAEGFDAGARLEFIRFLRIARRSASEVRSKLYLALDGKSVTQEELTSAYALAAETKRLINGMMGYVRKSRLTT